MSFASPIDYAATRKALVQALCAMTQLPANQVIRAEGQGPVQPRPTLPYLTFKFRQAAIRNGYDALVPATDEGDTKWRYVGSRGIGIDIMAFGRDQDEAYGLALGVQSGLQQEPYAGILSAAGLCVWTMGDVSDLTALLGTGFEGRALLECELWQGTSILVDLGQIDIVPVVGNIEDDGGKQTHIELTAKLAD
jgi:hypothetical protein